MFRISSEEPYDAAFFVERPSDGRDEGRPLLPCLSDVQAILGQCIIGAPAKVHDVFKADNIIAGGQVWEESFVERDGHPGPP